MPFQLETNYSGVQRSPLSVCLNIFLAISFTIFLVLLGSNYAYSAEVFEFNSKIEVEGCVTKKGCMKSEAKKVTQKVIETRLAGK